MLFVNCPNEEIGRRGSKPLAIVIHRTDGEYMGSRAWILDPKSQVSYHYMIAENGYTEQFVKDEDTAWSVGKVLDSTWPLLSNGKNPNFYTISIGLSGKMDSQTSIDQIASCARLVRDLSKKWNIPLDNLHVIRHHDIRADKVCPGQFVDTGAITYLAHLV